MQGGAVASTQVVWTIRFVRNTSFWNLLFLLPLVMTAALSTVGLALPSKFNPEAPVAQKLWMRWFFDVSKVKESSFFKSDLTDPPSDF